VTPLKAIPERWRVTVGVSIIEAGLQCEEISIALAASAVADLQRAVGSHPHLQEFVSKSATVSPGGTGGRSIFGPDLESGSGQSILLGGQERHSGGVHFILIGIMLKSVKPLLGSVVA
jgi:hypothetical protein